MWNPKDNERADDGSSEVDSLELTPSRLDLPLRPSSLAFFSLLLFSALGGAFETISQLSLSVLKALKHFRAATQKLHVRRDLIFCRCCSCVGSDAEAAPLVTAGSEDAPAAVVGLSLGSTVLFPPVVGPLMCVAVATLVVCDGAPAAGLPLAMRRRWRRDMARILP